MARKQIIKQTKNVAGETARELVALWRLVTTVALAMGAYILIPQDNWTFKVVGGILLVNATIQAVVHYTKR